MWGCGSVEGWIIYTLIGGSGAERVTAFEGHVVVRRIWTLLYPWLTLIKVDDSSFPQCTRSGRSSHLWFSVWLPRLRSTQSIGERGLFDLVSTRFLAVPFPLPS